MQRPPLRDLAVKYSSDKYFWHSFVPIYEQLFEGMKVKKLLEIGIGHEGLMRPFLPPGIPYVHGSSLRMWEEYFPEAQIFACDIREDTLINEGRIRSMYCDQSSGIDIGVMCSRFGLEFDVIIDDGSHLYEHQQLTAKMLLDCAKQLYVIEDVWANTGQLLVKEFGGEFWQGDKGRDDGLVIIRK